MGDFELGALPLTDGTGTRFAVWAPRAERMALELVAPEARVHEMPRGDDGVFLLELRDVHAGAEYMFVIDGDKRRPDPRSRHQPYGVHRASRVVDTRVVAGSDAAFAAPALEALVLYELHVGTFTAEGTFDSAIAQLPHLRELGVTAIELMPIGEFPGARNWGYDGAYAFAPQSSYGGPDGLARLIDACHAHGLACVLDVVYNHGGPEGSYLGDFAPYFSAHHHGIWGQALNFDGPDSDGVRRFVIENALYWLREYRIDGLRLDATDRMFDFSALHILRELQAEVQMQAARLGRPAYVIAESDLNDVRLIAPPSAGGFGLDAQWNDEFHHAARALLREEHAGFLRDFGRVSQLAKAFTHGFIYDGQRSPARRRRHGSSSRERPGRQFVVFAQNHDQVANTSNGKRLGALCGVERQKVGAALVACAPNLPLLFMGEEFATATPFHYFISHSDATLIEAVRSGRRAEHVAFGQAEAWLDPQAESTFEACKLDWPAREWPLNAQVLAFYRDLYALRREHAALAAHDKHCVETVASEAPPWLLVWRRGPADRCVLCVFNFGHRPARIPVTGAAKSGRYRLLLDSVDRRYGAPADSPRATASFELFASEPNAPPVLTCSANSAAIYGKQVAQESPSRSR